MEAASVASLRFVESQLRARKVDSIDMLPKEIRREIRKEAKKIALTDVFGEGHKLDKNGMPLEQGLGSPSNMTQQHIDAYIKAQTNTKFREKPEDGYEDKLKVMRAQLAECNARRRAEQVDDDDD